MLRFTLVLLALVSLAPVQLVQAEELNAGFVQGIWFGTQTVRPGEPTRIYVALRNNTDHDLTGTVRFTDNGVRVGTAYVSALPGRLVEAWTDWTPRYGIHEISASLSNVQVYAIGESPAAGDVENTVAKLTVFIDYDTDNDGIPNESDTDDDNDTVSDEDEVTNGTDPLKADARKDESEEKETQKEATEKNETEQNDSAPSTQSQGLERYIPNEAAKEVVEAVTEKIAETKSELDSYREERNDTIKEYFKANPATSTDEQATITRSRTAPDESFIESVIRGGKALIGSVYSFVLWALSSVLAYPAVLELVLLIGGLYLFYRLVRNIGSRRRPN